MSMSRCENGKRSGPRLSCGRRSCNAPSIRRNHPADPPATRSGVPVPGSWGAMLSNWNGTTLRRCRCRRPSIPPGKSTPSVGVVEPRLVHLGTGSRSSHESLSGNRAARKTADCRSRRPPPDRGRPKSTAPVSVLLFSPPPSLRVKLVAGIQGVSQVSAPCEPITLRATSVAANISPTVRLDELHLLVAGEQVLLVVFEKAVDRRRVVAPVPVEVDPAVEFHQDVRRRAVRPRHEAQRAIVRDTGDHCGVVVVGIAVAPVLALVRHHRSAVGFPGRSRSAARCRPSQNTFGRRGLSQLNAK